MKYRILAVIAILLMLFSITVSAEGYDCAITVSEDFISAGRDDDLSVLAQKLNVTPEQLSTYFEENDLIYFAVSDIEKSQIKISVSDDDFSSEISDISQLDDQALAEFSKHFAADGNAKIITSNDRKFICTKNVYNNNTGGTYTVTQYVTICDNKTFYFTGYNDGEDTSLQITSAFESFKLVGKPTPPPAEVSIWLIVLVIVGGIVFAALAVIMIIGIIRNVKSNDKD